MGGYEVIPFAARGRRLRQAVGRMGNLGAGLLWLWVRVRIHILTAPPALPRNVDGYGRTIAYACTDMYVTTIYHL